VSVPWFQEQAIVLGLEWAQATAQLKLDALRGPKNHKRRQAVRRAMEARALLMTGWQDSDLRVGSTGTYEALSKTTHNVNILLDKIGQFNREQAQAADICPYSVSMRKKKWFDAYGIEHVQISDKPHDHAFSRALANTILYRHAANQIHGPFAVVQMKTRKAETLQRIVGQPLRLHQFVLSARDEGRFEAPKGMPRVIEEDTVLLDETAQAMPLPEFADWLRHYENVNRWVLTLNIPPEILERGASVHPHYDIKYVGKEHFLHMLEEKKDNSYLQPVSSSEYLTTRYLNVAGTIWTFERIASAASNHCVVVTRGKKMGADVDVLSSDYIVEIPTFGARLPVKWLPGQIYAAIFAHALAMKTYTRADAFAKTRTYIKELGPRLPPSVVAHLASCMTTMVRVEDPRDSLPPELQSLWWRFRTWVIRGIHRVWRLGARLLFGVDNVLRAHPEYFRLEEKFFETAKIDRTVTPTPPATPYVEAAAGVAITGSDSGTIPSRSTETLQARVVQRTMSWARGKPKPMIEKGKLGDIAHHNTTERAELAEREAAQAAQAGPSNEEAPPEPQSVHGSERAGDAPGAQPRTPAQLRADFRSVTERITSGAFMPEVRQFIENVHRAKTLPRSDLPLPAPATPGICLIDALCEATGASREHLWDTALQVCSKLEIAQAYEPEGMSARALHRIACKLNYAINIPRSKGKANNAYVRGLPYWLGAYHGTEAVVEFVKGGPGYANHWIGRHTHQRVGGKHITTGLLPRPPKTPGGVTPHPQKDVNLRAGHIPPPPTPEGFTQYTPDFERAKRCYEAWVNNEWGKVFENLTPSEVLEAKTLFKSKRRARDTIALSIHVGAPGSGKSAEMKKWFRTYIKALDSLMHVNFTRLLLMEEWKSMLPPFMKDLGKRMLKTLEVSPGFGVKYLHIEELQQHPPGYLDMRYFLNPSLERVTATGDPLQNPWTPGKHETPLMLLENDLWHHRELWSSYSLVAHRCGQGVAHALGLETSSEHPGRVIRSFGRTPGMWTIEARTRTADATHAMDSKNITMQSCTGRTIEEDYQVIIDFSALHHVSAEVIFTSMSRGTRNVHLVWEAGADTSLLDHHRLWGPLWRGETISWESFQCPPLRTHGYVDLDHRGGTEALEKEPNAPAEFRALWSLRADTEEEPAVSLIEPADFEPICRTHLSAPRGILCTRYFEPLQSKEAMEFQFEGRTSNQVRDTRGDGMVNHLFAKQNSADDTLLGASVLKRMRFRDAKSNENHTRARAMLGSHLWGNFRARLNLPEEPETLDERLLNECREDMFAKKWETPLNTLTNNRDRCDPFTPENSAKIFAKAQDKAKRSTILTAVLDPVGAWWSSDEELPKVKPGQTLALFPDQVLLRLGPYTRYLHKRMLELLPPHIFLFGGQTPTDLDEWCKKWAIRGDVFTNDFTAYDQSCTGEAVQFEMAMMRYFGFPEELVAYYFWQKTTLTTNFGPSAVMRFTGEPGTYIFNSLFNLAYMLLKYQCEDVPSIYSGDDSLLFKVPALNPEWPKYEAMFTLVGKTFITDLPECCGWLCYPEGIVRDPLVLALKTVYKRNLGELDRVLDSYFLEHLHGYYKGDLISDILTPELVEMHAWFGNFAHSHSSLVRSLSRVQREDLQALVTRNAPFHAREARQAQSKSLLMYLPYLFGLDPTTPTHHGSERTLLHDARAGDVRHEPKAQEWEELRGGSSDVARGKAHPRQPQRGRMRVGRADRRRRGGCERERPHLLPGSRARRLRRTNCAGVLLECPRPSPGLHRQGQPPRAPHGHQDGGPVVQGQGWLVGGRARRSRSHRRAAKGDRGGPGVSLRVRRHLQAVGKGLGRRSGRDRGSRNINVPSEVESVWDSSSDWSDTMTHRSSSSVATEQAGESEEEAPEPDRESEEAVPPPPPPKTPPAAPDTGLPTPDPTPEKPQGSPTYTWQFNHADHINGLLDGLRKTKNRVLAPVLRPRYRFTVGADGSLSVATLPQLGGWRKLTPAEASWRIVKDVSSVAVALGEDLGLELDDSHEWPMETDGFAEADWTAPTEYDEV
jgi:hypothetical protein